MMKEEEVSQSGSLVHNDLEEPLIASQLQQPKISVVAPANLEVGYTFEASVDGRMFVVTVPAGGVLVGETIIVNYPEEKDFLDYPINPHSIPNYYWRDGLFECTSHGKCHPTMFCGFICPPLLAAQVMTRYWNVDDNKNGNNNEDDDNEAKQQNINETATATVEPERSSSNIYQKNNWLCWWRKVSPFRRMEFLVVLVGLIFIVLKMSFLIVKIKAYNDLPDTDELERTKHFDRLVTDAFLSMWGMFQKLDPLTTIIFIIQTFAVNFTIVTVIRLRRKIRLRYKIAPTTKCCGDNVCDDILLSSACLCCTVTQIARHTANYNQYEGSLQTETGLTPDAPPITTTTNTSTIPSTVNMTTTSNDERL